MLNRLQAIWHNDPTLRRVIQNSGRLLSGNAVSAALGFVQGILTVRLIGDYQWGLLTTIIPFATNINRLLSFRMNEVVTQRLGAALVNGKKAEGMVAVKAAMLSEAATSIFAFIVLVLLTPWAAVTFGKDPQTAPFFLLYGLIILGNITTESSTGVLQALRRFDIITNINIAQSIFTIVAVFLAFLAQRSLIEIIFILTLGKTINGLGLTFFSLRQMRESLNAHWWKTPLYSLPDARGMFSFMLNTNLNGSVYLFTRDMIPLFLAALIGPIAAGYFKLAQGLINLIMLPLDPLIGPTYAEISRLAALKEWTATRQLLRRISMMTGSIVFAVGSGLALTGWFVIPLLYGAKFAPAYPIMLILLVGYGFATIFQWNRPLFLALGKPGYPMLVALLVGVVELILIFTLVPTFGSLALAAILSANFVASIGIIVLRGLTEIRQREREDQPTRRLED